MKILVTGARGFIGRNLILELQNRGENDLCFCDVETKREELLQYAADCEVVFHLAGVNRPQREEEFMEGNFGFTSQLLEALKSHKNRAAIVCTSSIQALRDNPYGKSKLAGEELLLDYGKETGAEVILFRLSNVFGKWCRPNYNSVVATFCHNIARGLPVQINDPQAVLRLLHIDDVVNGLLNAAAHRELPAADGRYYIHQVHETTLSQLAARIRDFQKSRETLEVPDLSDDFTRKLYSTYLSYLPEDAFAYALNTHEDARGSFTEVLRQHSFGQVSVNVARPGITKGNHWHHTKHEKFLVLSGEGVIRFRRADPFEEDGRVIEYRVSGGELRAVDIPPGYTHSIVNVGECDLVTLMWANERFDPQRPDTYFKEV